MSNSPLVSYTKISPSKTSPRNHKIDTITIHCVVGQLSVETIGQIFQYTNSKKQASSNYGIGYDGRIGMYVEEKDRAFTTSSRSNDNRAITIEVASDLKDPYAVNSAAYESLITLLVDICLRNDIKELKWKNDPKLIGKVDQQNMTVHRWFANKACPGEYLLSRHSQIADEVNRRIKLEKIAREGRNEEESMNDFINKFNELRETLRDNDSSAYSKEAREWATETGLIQGNGEVDPVTNEPNYMWEDFLTREQFITVLYRFTKMIENM